MSKTCTEEEMKRATEKERNRFAAIQRAYQEILAKRDEEARIVHLQLNKALEGLAHERTENENLRYEVLQ